MKKIASLFIIVGFLFILTSLISVFVIDILPTHSEDGFLSLFGVYFIFFGSSLKKKYHY